MYCLARKEVIMRRIVIIFLVYMLCLFQISCSNANSLVDRNDSQPKVNGENNGRKFSVWITYWDLKNYKQELSAIGNSIDNICYFAAYFDADEKLFIPKEITDTFGEINATYGSKKYHSYLTFVNDLIKTEGTSSLKDTELLYHLFSSTERMDRHISEIIDMTVKGGFDGIEIDYEGMDRDITLWKMYLQFIKKLYKTASAKKIPVRILLEPKVPITKIKFFKGPEYVMMCYNLYGDGTVPGPKANEKFLKQMVDKMKPFTGKVNFALSSGGYDFAGDGSAKQVSEIEAETLKKEYNAASRRDSDSNCIVFTYQDLQGLSHEIWYADKQTLNYWYNTINKYGDYGISLWRIGGNVCNDFLNIN